MQELLPYINLSIFILLIIISLTSLYFQIKSYKILEKEHNNNNIMVDDNK